MPDDEDDFRREMSFSHHGGRASSLEEAERQAKQLSGSFYSQGHDQDAQNWRKVAIWLGEMACDARKEQKKYQKQFSGGV